MIDYKLVLILVLSIVLLYLYNRVDYLKDDLKNQKKIQNDQKELIETINRNLETITKRNIELEKKFRLSNNLVNNNNLENNNLNSKPKINNEECLDGICKMPQKNDQKINTPQKNDSINKLNITLLNNNEKNTTEFSATENDSDSESLNLTSSDNIILYSNDKSDKSSVNKSDVESIDTNNIINVENIEITHDLQKDNTVLLGANTIDEIINVESLIDKLTDEPILFNKTFLNTNLDKKPSSYLEIIDSSNSNESEDNNQNLNENNIIAENKKSYSDLDYDNSEDKSKILNNSEDKSSEKNMDSITLEDFNKYKLNELQNIAKEKNIELTIFKNGKVKNKTKKELYNEISNL